MDQAPTGMTRCFVTDGVHRPLFNIMEQRTECMDCQLEISEWSIYIPQWDSSVTMWLSETTIYEEPF